MAPRTVPTISAEAHQTVKRQACRDLSDVPLDSLSWNGTRGSILIVVLWVIVLLSLLIAGLGSRGAFALDVTVRMHEGLALSSIALGGIQQAVSVLARDPTPAFDGLSNEEWFDNGSLFANQLLGDGVFTVSYPTEATPPQERYGFVDEDRSINLNTAPADVLQALVGRVGGLRGEEAMRAAEAIQDWRDKDTEQRPLGAENFYYQSLSDPYPCKDGPFENIEELLLVKGVTPEVFTRIAPFVTVYGSGQVNLNTAPPAVLRALGLTEAGVKGIVFYRLGEDNTEGTSDDRVLTSVTAITAELSRYVPAEDVNRLTQLVQAKFLTVKSESFRLSITAQTDTSKSPLHVECVVSRKGPVEAMAEH